MDMKVELCQNLKTKPVWEDGNLPFGRVFTDYMMQMDYSADKGWHDACIIPYAPFQLDPATLCLHYGQMIFEGMKAYRRPDGKIALFRPRENMARMNESAWRMCMPAIDGEDALNSLMKLIELEKDWVPPTPNSSLYLRPFMFATEAQMIPNPSATYRFAIIMCPVQSLYKGGVAPVRICVEEEYVRAVKGGTGAAKCAGNYAAAMRSQLDAASKGFAQVLWLDGVHRKYIEEVGTMNVVFVIDGVAVTPELTGSILPGVTRKSVIEMLRDSGMKVEERPISIDELAKAYDDGKLDEAFGCGTAAVVSSIGELTWGSKVMDIGGGGVGKVTQKVYDELTGIQFGTSPDTRGWVTIVC